MDTNDKTVDKVGNLVLDIYRYAYKYNLDITNPEDIKRILMVLKPENHDDIDIDILIQGLVAIDRLIKKDVAKRGKPAN